MAATLKKLIYFDGRLLRAGDAKLEQSSIWDGIRYTNQAVGRGVVSGLELSLDEAGLLSVAPGLAIDGSGGVLLSDETLTFDAQRLARDTAAQAFGAAAAAAPLTFAVYLDAVPRQAGVALSCAPPGDRNPQTHFSYEETSGKLRFERLQISPAHELGFQVSSEQWRSALASSLFMLERRVHHRGSPLLTRPDLRSRGLVSSAGIALGVLCCAGGRPWFVDAWALRREALEPWGDELWSHRMRNRPRALFLAETLQFQAQLQALNHHGPTPLRDVGIVELPSAGYVDVDIQRPLRPQLESIFRGASSLRMIEADLDDIASHLDGARDLDRVSLLKGRRRDLDVFVPRLAGLVVDKSWGFDVQLDGSGLWRLLQAVRPNATGRETGVEHLQVPLVGSARVTRDGARLALTLAAGGLGGRLTNLVQGALGATGRDEHEAKPHSLAPEQRSWFVRAIEFVKEAFNGITRRIQVAVASDVSSQASLFVELEAFDDPMQLEVGQSTTLRADCTLTLHGDESVFWFGAHFIGTLTILSAQAGERKATLAGTIEERIGQRTETHVMSFEEIELGVGSDGFRVRRGDDNQISLRLDGGRAFLNVGDESSASTVADFNLDENAFQQGQEHLVAMRALQLIARTAPPGLSFSQRAPARLFEGRVSAEKQALPGLPWVMFRARAPQHSEEMLDIGPNGGAGPETEKLTPQTSLVHEVTLSGARNQSLRLPEDAASLRKAIAGFVKSTKVALHPQCTAADKTQALEQLQNCGIKNLQDQTDPALPSSKVVRTTINLVSVK